MNTTTLTIEFIGKYAKEVADKVLAGDLRIPLATFLGNVEETKISVRNGDVHHKFKVRQVLKVGEY